MEPRSDDHCVSTTGGDTPPGERSVSGRFTLENDEFEVGESGGRGLIDHDGHIKQFRLKINQRERMRMHDLNAALDGLREVMPYANGPSVRKLSKIATMLLAKNYILMLQSSLEEMKKLVSDVYGSKKATLQNTSHYSKSPSADVLTPTIPPVKTLSPTSPWSPTHLPSSSRLKAGLTSPVPKHPSSSIPYIRPTTTPKTTLHYGATEHALHIAQRPPVPMAPTTGGFLSVHPSLMSIPPGYTTSNNMLPHHLHISTTIAPAGVSSLHLNAPTILPISKPPGSHPSPLGEATHISPHLGMTSYENLHSSSAFSPPMSTSHNPSTCPCSRCKFSIHVLSKTAVRKNGEVTL